MRPLSQKEIQIAIKQIQGKGIFMVPKEYNQINNFIEALDVLHFGTPEVNAFSKGITLANIEDLEHYADPVYQQYYNIGRDLGKILRGIH